MNFELKFDIPDKFELKKEISDKAKKVLFLSMNKLQELAVQKAPVDTGMLKRSINLFPYTEGYTEYKLIASTEYAAAIEYGTSPHYPPTTPIKGWSRRVLGDENLAYAVAGSIAKSGTSAQPYMRPALMEVQNKWIKYYWNKI